MKINQLTRRIALLIMLMLTITILSVRMRADTGTCGGEGVMLPFTDTMGNFFFCQIAAAYFSGLTNGTTATTYSPGASVPREQMAAFVTRTLDQSLRRGHPRAALGEWWTNKTTLRSAGTLTGFHNPRFLASDGLTVWASNTEGNTVSRVDIKTGELICTLSGVLSPEQIVIVSGTVFVASFQSPGRINFADLSVTTNQPMNLLGGNMGDNPVGITFDGQNLWTANDGSGPGTGSISRSNGIGSVATFTTGFSQPRGILFDGANLWVADAGDSSLKRVDTTSAAVLQTIPLSGTVGHPVFDGTNLWIPCGDRMFVVRSVGGSTGTVPLGTVLAQLTGNGLNGAFAAAFDGERICVTNASAGGVSLWKATDLSPIGAVNALAFGYNPRGVCSDGVTFFVGLRDPMGGSGSIVRF